MLLGYLGRCEIALKVPSDIYVEVIAGVRLEIRNSLVYVRFGEFFYKRAKFVASDLEVKN